MVNPSNKPIVDVTVILNVWKRNYFEEQIISLLNQSFLPKNIWIFQCENNISIKPYLEKFPFLEHIQSTMNLKYFGRYGLATYVQTEFCWILDDDMIPSSTWLEICVKTSNKYNAIICSNGRIISPNDFHPEIIKGPDYLSKHFIGDSFFPNNFNVCKEDTVVDYGCSSYFFKSEWLHLFWAVPPFTLEMAEDIHLSASCKILKNIPTVIPKQTSLNDSGNIKPVYSIDDFASWKKASFIDQRSEVLNYLINKKNWRPQLWN